MGLQDSFSETGSDLRIRQEIFDQVLPSFGTQQILPVLNMTEQK